MRKPITDPSPLACGNGRVSECITAARWALMRCQRPRTDASDFQFIVVRRKSRDHLFGKDTPNVGYRGQRAYNSAHRSERSGEQRISHLEADVRHWNNGNTSVVATRTPGRGTTSMSVFSDEQRGPDATGRSVRRLAAVVAAAATPAAACAALATASSRVVLTARRWRAVHATRPCRLLNWLAVKV